MYSEQRALSITSIISGLYFLFGLLTTACLATTNFLLDKSHIERELRFVQVNECLPRPGSDRIHGSLPYKRRMLHCPPGALLHIQQAYVGQTFSSDSKCLFLEHAAMSTDTRDEEFQRMQLIDPSDRKLCSTKSIGHVIQSLCHGLNTCDVVSKLSEMEEVSQCRHRMDLDVNYTCLPAFSQPELICADSYVELTCTAFGSDSNMLILKANSLHNLSSLSELPEVVKKNHCAKTEETADCQDLDVTSFYADMCNRRTVCTINPNMAPQHKVLAESHTTSKFSIASHESLTSKQQCAKFHLYLEYTCANDILLKPLRSLESTGGFRRKSERKTKKRERHGSLEEEETFATGVNETSSLVTPVMNQVVYRKAAESSVPVKEAASKDDSDTQQPDAQSSVTVQSSDSSRLILISLLPSAICLVLVILLIFYTIRQKHPQHLRAIKGTLPLRRDPTSSGFNKLHSADNQNLLSTDCYFTSHEMTRGECSVSEQLSTSPLYPKHSTTGVHPWNQVSLPHTSIGSASVVGSSCCGCSPNFSRPHCPGSVSPGVVRNQCGLLALSMIGGNLNTTASSQIDPDTTMSDLVGSSCGNRYTTEPGTGKDYDKNEKVHQSAINNNLLRPDNPTSSQSNAETEKLELGRKDNQLYLDMKASQVNGSLLGKPYEQISYPPSPHSASRSTNIRPQTQMTESKCEVYTSSMVTKTAATIPQHVRTLFPASIQLNSNSQDGLVPPLFNQIEQFGGGFCGSFSANFDSAIQKRRRTHTIPVVRYPHESEAAEDSCEDSQSEEELQHGSTETVTATIRINGNRPDLCPPVNNEKKGLKAMHAGRGNEIVHRSLSFTKYQTDLENDSHGESLYTSERYNRNSPSRCVAPSGTILQLGNRGSPTRLGKHQDIRVTKSLRFQTPFSEKCIAEYGNRISGQNESEISSSMCHSILP